MELFIDIFVLVILVFMARKRIQLGHVFVITSFLFGVLHNISLLTLGKSLATTFLSPSTLTILGALFFINMMEHIMSNSGSKTRLVSSLKSLSGNPCFAMAALPAFIGLLPSPGGAKFSAPMVEEAAKDVTATGEQKAVINYYYRHVWEYFLPLYPANLLAVEILNIPTGKFIMIMFPFTLITLLIGTILFRNIHVIPNTTDINKIETGTLNNINNTYCKKILYIFEGILPVITVVLLVLILKLHIVLALLIVVSLMIIYYKVDLITLVNMVKKSLSPKLYYVIFGAIYFRDILQASGSIDLLLNYFESIDLNPLLITILFPFSISLLTGLTIPGITIALPIIITLAAPTQIMSYACLAFVSNFIGAMLSPMHLCLILSIDHFSANFTKTFRLLYIPEAILLIFAILYSQYIL